jgi:hypothetical protein
MLYAFFWVIPGRLNFIYRRFGTLCLFHLYRQVGRSSHLPAYEDGTECAEKSAYKIQTPGNYPEESIQHGYFCSLEWVMYVLKLSSIFVTAVWTRRVVRYCLGNKIENNEMGVTCSAYGGKEETYTGF